MAYDFTQKHVLLKPLGFVGSKFMTVWRMSPCGKKKSKKSKAGGRRDSLNGAENIADSIGAADNEGGAGGTSDLDDLMGLTGGGAESNTIVFEEVNFEEMSLLNAAIGGYLLKEEYYALIGTFALFFAIFLMGFIISLSDNLGYVGHMIWCMAYVLILTAAAFTKYFSTFRKPKEDRSLMVSIAVAGLVLLGFCVAFFLLEEKDGEWEMEADPSKVEGLVLLNILILYPTAVLVCFKMYRWKDNNWVITVVDEDGDGRMSCRELVKFFGFGPIAFFLAFIGCLELFIFDDKFLATSVLLLLCAGLVVVIFLRDWAQNDFWLTAKYQNRADWLINGLQVASMACAVVLGTESRMFCLSLFFLFYMLECAAEVGAAWVTMESGEPVYFSPFLLPVYSFSAAIDDIKDETTNVIWFFKFLGAGCAWGVTLAM